LALDIDGLQNVTESKRNSLRHIQEDLKKLHVQDLHDLEDSKYDSKREHMEHDIVDQIHDILGDKHGDDYDTFKISQAELDRLDPKDRQKLELLYGDLEILREEDQHLKEKDDSKRELVEEELIHEVQDILHDHDIDMDQILDLDIDHQPGLTNHEKDE